MVLIVAEKPSLGRNIAGSIGNLTSKNGYMEGNGYIVTWAFGHLFSLADIEEYSPSPREDRRWTMENLPCFPKEFRFELRKGSDKKVDSGVVKQFELIRTLCNRDDVDTIVNAGDADREGEIIVRLCVKHALKGEKTFKRLWLPDQTPQTVAAALADHGGHETASAFANAQSTEKITKYLGEHSMGYTVFEGHGSKDKMNMIFIVLPRKETPRVLRDIRKSCDNKVFVVASEDIKILKK